MCNTSRAKKVIALLAVLMFAINFHFFWTSGISKNGENEACMAAPKFHQLVEEIWPWVDAFIYSFFPFGVIMTLNALIVREVARARSNRLLMAGSEQVVYGMDASRATDQLNTAQIQMQQRNNSRARDDKSKLTALLLTVSFTFLLLTLPNNISLIVTHFWNKRVASNTEVG
ncbi:FMRFamide receptor-like [Plakobranchus ocellatus]|uniref:FMRFamide receptor-like n=1 Tax=Plakobranchus ocellatus TaxID=259542 RepID=A0AAV4A8S4_9GAST|nr:FMRFamide receptor-like [Plakobranchus ocellatus]